MLWQNGRKQKLKLHGKFDLDDNDDINLLYRSSSIWNKKQTHKTLKNAIYVSQE